MGFACVVSLNIAARERGVLLIDRALNATRETEREGGENRNWVIAALPKSLSARRRRAAYTPLTLPRDFHSQLSVECIRVPAFFAEELKSFDDYFGNVEKMGYF